MNTQLFIFDMDGLMLDTESLYYKIWQSIFQSKGNYKLNFEFYKNLIGTPTSSLEVKYKNEFGQDFPYEDYFNEYRKIRDKKLKEEGAELKYGLKELLIYLNEKNLKCAVATSSFRAMSEPLLIKCGIYHYFDIAIFGDEIKNGKPSPEIFLKALELANVKPENAIVLEDSINGILASHKADIPCIFVKDIVTPSNEVLALAYDCPHSLMDVKIKFENSMNLK